MAEAGADLREVTAAQASVRQSPSPDASLDTEALKGERVIVHEMTAEGWCRGTLEADGYSGWLPAGALGRPGPPATHKVAVPRTLVFPGPSIKLPPLDTLSFGCRLGAIRTEEPFVILPGGGYVPTRHLIGFNEFVSDPVAIAEMFLHVPYLWGGKTSLGVDCSGLMQLALTACGLSCPRDSHMQEAALGAPLSGEVRRGDLLFWRGHVAIARDERNLIHANAFHMAVAIEPIAEAVARIGAPTSVRRIDGKGAVRPIVA
jgi:NlpC/P60 family/Bacterial dipeptidyl-peptidase Sh3 domain